MSEQLVTYSACNLTKSFVFPVYTWRCRMFGVGGSGVCIQVEEKNVPNWFWRKMQYLILGNEWKKL